MIHAANTSICISMIAAMAQNRVIGDGEAMPWHIPEDLQLFKRLTLGKPVVMGRKTYDSIGRPLPNRDNIVVTRNADWHENGVFTAASPEAGLRLAIEKAIEKQLDEVIIMGGGTIYQQLLPFANRIYLTHIMKPFKGKALFPDLPAKDWQRQEDQRLETKQDYGFEIVFARYERAANTAQNLHQA